MKQSIKFSVVTLAVALASAALVGCGGSQNESYQGVPLGKSCEQVYKQSANLTKCKAQDSRH